MVTSEDVSLMRVSGSGEVFFASEAGFVYLVDLTGDALSVNAATCWRSTPRSGGTSSGCRVPG